MLPCDDTSHVVTVMIVLSGIARAQNWVRLDKHPDTELFIDMSSIRMEGDFVTYWTKSVHATSQQVGGNGAFYQIGVDSWAVNCLAHTIALTSTSAYTLKGDRVNVFSYNPPNFLSLRLVWPLIQSS
jgi:hypothetical protein